MNVYAISIGILVTTAIIYLFNVEKDDDIQVLYALYLANFPIYYWIFSIYAGNFTALFNEILAGIPFIVIACLCYKVNSRPSMRLLASGYLLHAVYDFSHASLLINPGVANWWPEFSGVINLLLGVYLLVVNIRSRQSTVNNTLGHCT